MELELQNNIKISVTENEEFKEEFIKIKDLLENAHIDNQDMAKLLVLSKLISDPNIYSKFIDQLGPIEIPSTKTGLLRLILLHPRDYVRVNGKGSESMKFSNMYPEKLSQVVYHYAIENPWGK